MAVSDSTERTRLMQLSAKLRDATCAALNSRSALARALDDSRAELERLLMMSAVDATEFRRVVMRAQMMLDAWQGMVAGMSVRFQ